jgi:hypothetical protein
MNFYIFPGIYQRPTGIYGLTRVFIKSDPFFRNSNIGHYIYLVIQKLLQALSPGPRYILDIPAFLLSDIIYNIHPETGGIALFIDEKLGTVLVYTNLYGFFGYIAGRCQFAICRNRDNARREEKSEKGKYKSYSIYLKHILTTPDICYSRTGLYANNA